MSIRKLFDDRRSDNNISKIITKEKQKKIKVIIKLLSELLD
jgi:hypothetical protein